MEALWQAEQDDLKKRLTLEDAPELTHIKYVAGVDISFIKDTDTACAGLVIMDYPALNIVFSTTELIKIEVPYISGFLAFREVEPIKKLIDALKDSRPELIPQVIFVDGNGVLHSRGFGLACHLGVLCDIPTIGIGKTFYQKNEAEIKAVFRRICHNRGDYITIIDNAYAVLTADNLSNPIYVSSGHKISGETAIKLALECCRFKLPEPIRFADHITREFLRKMKI